MVHLVNPVRRMVRGTRCRTWCLRSHDVSASYEIVAGDPGSPVVLHVPHSSREVSPDARRSILLDDAALEGELDAMTDAWTDRIAEAARAAAARTAPARPTPWAFVNRRSRLVVDPERFPDDREEMLAVGMGAVYTRTSQRTPLREDDPAVTRELVDRYFHPYADALTELVQQRLDACATALILDVHSYPTRALPYEVHQDESRPEICLGVDEHHTPPELVEAARVAFAGFGTVTVNEPFHGTYVPLDFYRTDPRVRSLMIEIRRDVYVDGSGAPIDEAVSALGQATASLLTPPR